MSLARALTKRYRPGHHDDAPPDSPRSFGSSRKGSYIDRAKISLPVELLSTTNVLAYDAPDIHPINTQSPLSAMSSSSSRKSYDDSDASPGLSSSSSVSSAHMSRESSPITPDEPTDLPPYLHTKAFASTIMQEPTEPEAPSVPARALSHTKKSHQALARKRSQTQLAHPTEPAPASPTSTRRPSFDFNFKTEPSHPFGAELDQVDEIAEEFGVKENVRIWDEEEQFLVARGLLRFDVEDYLAEIEPLKFGLWDDAPSSPTMSWL